MFGRQAGDRVGGATSVLRRLIGEPWDLAAALGMLVLPVLVAVTFRHYGISNDEEVQHVYGAKLIDWYRSGFVDESAFSYKNLYLYGGLFDMAAVALAPLLPFDPYETRHLLCALIGVAGIAVAWGVGRRLAGPRAGFLAGALLALCGPWYGGLFNHTKDVPFAVLMMAAVGLLIRLAGQMPRPRWGTVLGFGAVAGLALGIRVGALLLAGYMAAMLVGWVLVQGFSGARLREAGRGALRLLPALPVAYGLMAVFWPWAVLEPLNPLRALADFSHFHYPIRTMLGGTEYWMYEVPRGYLARYLAVKLPLVMLAGAILGLMGLPAILRRDGLADGEGRTRAVGCGLVALAALFPVVWFTVTHAPGYTAIRHFLFVLPPLAVLGGIGLDRLLGWAGAWRFGVSQRSGRGLSAAAFAGVALALALGREAAVLESLHPDEYVYFNELVGGVAGAVRKYDVDYWANSLPEAVEDLSEVIAAEEARTHRHRSYSVAVCAEPLAFEKLAPANLHWVTDWTRADFFIAPTQEDCDALMTGPTVAEVERDGALLAVVKDLRKPVEPAEMVEVARLRTGRQQRHWW
ncbi:glycosyltransferase family 39 protein [Azospirillum sp. YIM B02556]|uniref:Glycosyltransferase family 39 protein n=1 Tax=Azospirillum endophyticum TaxID=2800326 RepID=A0ABS1F8B0_9PROT|nr:glycosyltransferase family 39 protein [Azospirillum endophyticum]MBK1839647.1 glycosyltransferase family 39 protein [Azospirillum endophyticum]